MSCKHHCSALPYHSHLNWLIPWWAQSSCTTEGVRREALQLIVLPPPTQLPGNKPAMLQKTEWVSATVWHMKGSCLYIKDVLKKQKKKKRRRKKKKRTEKKLPASTSTLPSTVLHRPPEIENEGIKKNQRSNQYFARHVWGSNHIYITHKNCPKNITFLKGV